LGGEDEEARHPCCDVEGGRISAIYGGHGRSDVELASVQKYQEPHHRRDSHLEKKFRNLSLVVGFLRGHDRLCHKCNNQRLWQMQNLKVKVREGIHAKGGLSNHTPNTKKKKAQRRTG